ncbi:hypothetical protein U2I53_05655 [Lysinibacillus capsici]|uniref:hypothetical protein n=1 Tax=Lysinibacillus capsici TaxID=2115968 RepID=UPI0032DEC43A
MMNAYKNVMKQIHASEEFKRKMQEEMMKYEKRSFMKKVRISVGSLVACAVIAVLAMVNINHETPIDLTDRIVADHSAPAASALVNIEGTITEVGEDGLSFTLDNGMEVVVTDKTKIGIDGPTAPPKEEQLFEPTFRVGNLIGGYTEDTSSNPVQAAAIYTNWNFEHPLR